MAGRVNKANEAWAIKVKAKLAAERAAYSKKMAAKTAAKRAKEARSNQIKAERKAAEQLAIKNETTSLHKTAGITTFVKKQAALGNPEAIKFLSAARGRYNAAKSYLVKNPITYKMGKLTYTYKDANFKRKMSRVIAAGESVKAFQQAYATATKNLARAKGAAKGASLKAGPSGGKKLGSTSQNVFDPKTGGTLYKVSLQDGI